MGTVIELRSFRRRSSTRAKVGRKMRKDAQAAELLRQAALLLSEGSPEHARIAWMVQDLRELLLEQRTKKFARDDRSTAAAQKGSLTNLS